MVIEAKPFTATLCMITSVITSKPANDDQVKTGQRADLGTKLLFYLPQRPAKAAGLCSKIIVLRQTRKRGPHNESARSLFDYVFTPAKIPIMITTSAPA